MSSKKDKSSEDIVAEEKLETAKKIIKEAAEVEQKLPVEVAARLALNKGVHRRRELLDYYNKEEKVEVYLAPMYASHFGRIMNVMLNGISITFPVDGQKHLVPKSFAEVIEERRLAVDNLVNQQHNMANVQENIEQSPGELRLI